jgi:hypothetical protein
MVLTACLTSLIYIILGLITDARSNIKDTVNELFKVTYLLSTSVVASYNFIMNNGLAINKTYDTEIYLNKSIKIDSIHIANTVSDDNPYILTSWGSILNDDKVKYVFAIIEYKDFVDLDIFKDDNGSLELVANLLFTENRMSISKRSRFKKLLKTNNLNIYVNKSLSKDKVMQAKFDETISEISKKILV